MTALNEQIRRVTEQLDYPSIIAGLPDQLVTVPPEITEQFATITDRLDFSHVFNDLPDTSALLNLNTNALTDQLQSITQQLDYPSIIAGLPEAEQLRSLGITGMSETFAAAVEGLDLSGFHKSFADRASELLLDSFPSAGRLAFEEFTAGFDLAGGLDRLNWKETFEQALGRSESIIEQLTTEAQRDTTSTDSSLSNQDAALLAIAALVIAIVVGGELLALLLMVSAELAFAADLTLRAAAEVGNATPQLQGAAYLYFIGEVVARIARAVSSNDGEPEDDG